MAFKIEFTTVRELEKKTFRVFKYAGAMLSAGVVLSLMGLGGIGVPVMVLGGVAVIAAIAWVSMLGKEKSRPTFCPYCAGKNDVFISRRSFNCGLCGRSVALSECGEPILTELADFEAQ